MSLRAVIFDFDGVIANSEPFHLRSYQEVLANAGITLTSTNYYDRYLGYDDVGVFRMVMRDLNRELDDEDLREFIVEKYERFNVLINNENTIIPEAVTCVRHLAKELPLAIASGALLKEIEPIIKKAGIQDCFKTIVSADAGIPSKPAPDPYLRAVELLETHRSKRFEQTSHTESRTQQSINSHYVAIEDSHWGIESAISAGLRCVAVTQTYGPTQLGRADLIVPDLSVLTVAMLRDLCRRNY